MQKALENVLNAGIALFRSGKEGVGSAVREVQHSFEVLRKKGANDKSEAAIKLRATLDDLTYSVNQLTEKTGSVYKETFQPLQEKYESLLGQIKKIIPEGKAGKVKAKSDELRQTIKEKASKSESK